MYIDPILLRLLLIVLVVVVLFRAGVSSIVLVILGLLFVFVLMEPMLMHRPITRMTGRGGYATFDLSTVLVIVAVVVALVLTFRTPTYFRGTISPVFLILALVVLLFVINPSGLYQMIVQLWWMIGRALGTI